MKLGFKSYDALHLSCARKAGVNIFISTDDKLVKKACKNQDTLNIKVDNPLHWLQEVL
jgi:predicted nucleic acid-binding protein